jgi:hypothetical protein
MRRLAPKRGTTINISRARYAKRLRRSGPRLYRLHALVAVIGRGRSSPRYFVHGGSGRLSPGNLKGLLLRQDAEFTISKWCRSCLKHAGETGPITFSRSKVVKTHAILPPVIQRSQGTSRSTEARPSNSSPICLCGFAMRRKPAFLAGFLRGLSGIVAFLRGVLGASHDLFESIVTG